MAALIKVSVILPVYNTAPFVEEAVESVLAQRGVPFELLIGDDASTDGSWEQIRRYRSDSRVRAWRFRAHRGIGGTRNLLHARARGRYLSICDSDDRMLPGNLRRLSDALDRWPSVGLVYPTRRVLGKSGRILPDRLFAPEKFLPWDLLRMQAPHPGTMVRKTAMERVGGYREDFPVSVDFDLFLRLGEVTRFRSVGGPPLYLRRMRSDSTSHSHSRKTIQRLVHQMLRETISRRYGFKVPW